ncbi:DEAD/DEAH box helicase [Lentzea sp. NPDC055074]
MVVQFLRLGSVNALAEALSPADDAGLGKRVHPNRLHGLLSEDAARSVNTATLEVIEAGLQQLEALPVEAGDDRIKQRIAAAVDEAPPEADRITWAAAHLGLPVAVVRRVAPRETGDTLTTQPASPSSDPDWSWQNDAIRAALHALRKAPRHRVGLIIPTGGGKTNIALQVALQRLDQDATRSDSTVVWVTHRRQLRTQARRSLQRLLQRPDMPENAAALFAHRIEFIMVNDLAPTIQRLNDRLELIIIDEAHHAAAPSYEPIFTAARAPVLLLTATPNRTDRQAIGIDEVAYTTSYRHLFERGCLVTPVFDPPLDLYGLDWTTVNGLYDLADYLLDRTESDFRKLLVTVTTRDKAEMLHQALIGLNDARDDHPFDASDIGYVHAERSSVGIAPSDFLDEFAGRPAGLLVATGQLIGEGFDDPSIDAVVVTYASTSISHLMQVAGRALRWAPGKGTAHVVQVRENALQYHFDQRWLYQDISDQLRPALVDMTFSSTSDLSDQVARLLDQHRVSAAVRRRILGELAEIEPYEDVSIMFTGVPYFGGSSTFNRDAEWGAICVSPAERVRFLRIFNDVSSRVEDIKEELLYLPKYIQPDSRAGSLWKSYVDLIAAMEYARREIQGSDYADRSSRGYELNLSTTWLQYVTIKYRPTLPDSLQEFLRDVVNANEIAASYVATPYAWSAAVKVELPLTGYFAYLLSVEQESWLEANRRALINELRNESDIGGWAVLVAWRSGLPVSPMPMVVMDQISQLTRPERFVSQYLALDSEKES